MPTHESGDAHTRKETLNMLRRIVLMLALAALGLLGIAAKAECAWCDGICFSASDCPGETCFCVKEQFKTTGRCVSIE